MKTFNASTQAPADSDNDGDSDNDSVGGGVNGTAIGGTALGMHTSSLPGPPRWHQALGLGWAALSAEVLLMMLLLVLLLVLPAAALAQFKIVQPDGSITYTDRPPLASEARVTDLRSGRAVIAPGQSAQTELPATLRGVAQRYPVTLYVSADCAPCAQARTLLQRRGVPYAEKTITTDLDTLALERLVGTRLVPSLTIGPQPLRGFAEQDWTTYLDAAGYPRESMLPRGWKLSSPTPLTSPSATDAQPATTAGPLVRPATLPPPSSTPSPADLPASPTGIRF